MICCSELNNCSAKALATSVFPTPVGPKNKNEPIGLFSSLIPALLLKIAFETKSTASSCPITLSLMFLFNYNNLALSLVLSLLTGIFVHLAITSFISSSSTISSNIDSCFVISFEDSIFFCNSGITLYCNLAACS